MRPLARLRRKKTAKHINCFMYYIVGYPSGGSVMRRRHRETVSHGGDRASARARACTTKYIVYFVHNSPSYINIYPYLCIYIFALYIYIVDIDRRLTVARG